MGKVRNEWIAEESLNTEYLPLPPGRVTITSNRAVSPVEWNRSPVTRESGQVRNSGNARPTMVTVSAPLPEYWTIPECRPPHHQCIIGIVRIPVFLHQFSPNNGIEGIGSLVGNTEYQQQWGINHRQLYRRIRNSHRRDEHQSMNKSNIYNNRFQRIDNINNWELLNKSITHQHIAGITTTGIMYLVPE